MCGIVGTVTFNGEPADPARLGRMCAALEHRGPDSRGIHAENGVGLGIQRLRVIDLETGDQPIYNEDRSIVVVLNGEIYNFKDLRERLLRRGHHFATEGDTETIVHLYEEEGVNCVKSLHGMFAFALWDDRRHQLLLARDRVGKKPLFFSLQGARLSFASELAALMQDERIPNDIDHQAVECYLAYQYVPGPLSIYRAVRKLPPATTMVVRQGQVEQRRYWNLDYSRKRAVSSPAELGEEIRDTIRQAVARRMVADVPVGAFLSGGVDSSAVVAAMSEVSDRPIRTFSIGFSSARYNELQFAREVAKMYETEHQEFIVEPQAIDILPKLVGHYGEPFADSSAIPSYYLAELTRRHVTVALNGDGGDESFAGYNRYVAQLMSRRLDVLPVALRRIVAAGAARISPSAEPTATRDRLRRLGASLTLEPCRRYERSVSYFDELQRERLLTKDYREIIGSSVVADVICGPWHEAVGDSLVDVVLEVDVNTYLPGDLLVKMDIATMAHGLEARSPLLDQQFMEFAAALPPDSKVRGTEKKYAFREALRPWVPDAILDRPKQGFSVPIDEWFRGELGGYVQEVLFDPGTVARGYFNEDYVHELVASHIAGRQDNSTRIWSLLVLELWHREFIDGWPSRAVTAAPA